MSNAACWQYLDNAACKQYGTTVPMKFNELKIGAAPQGQLPHTGYAGPLILLVSVCMLCVGIVFRKATKR